MNTPKDGGPAFPVVMSTDTHSPTIEDGPKRLENGYGYIASVGGMTMRQWYKGQVAKGLAANPDFNSSISGFAREAAQRAEALMAEDSEHARKEQK